MTGRATPDRRLAILSFHKIGHPPPDGWETWNYIPEAIFVEQLSQLGTMGWEVIDVDLMLQGLEQPHLLPERAALLTFDDGYASMVTVTLPVLERFGYPGVSFVPTDFIGRTNVWDVDNEPEERICDWDELRHLEAGGVSVQSHSASHPWFSSLTLGELHRELQRSKAALEDGLQTPVDVLAFPYGDEGRDSGDVRQALQVTGYRAACLYGGGPSGVPVSDPYRLGRLTMGPDTDLPSALQGSECS